MICGYVLLRRSFTTTSLIPHLYPLAIIFFHLINTNADGEEVSAAEVGRLNTSLSFQAARIFSEPSLPDGMYAGVSQTPVVRDFFREGDGDGPTVTVLAD
jgi:hypothetical protein